MELRALLSLGLLIFVGCGNAANGNGNGDGGSDGDGGIVNTASCADPASACGDKCVDLQNDPANCGDCGHACAAANAEHALCIAGTCTYDTCSKGFADCDGNVANGCELPTSSDVANCGGCGIVCAPQNGTAPTCTMGLCGFSTCSAGFADCDSDASNGCETTLATDDANCGKCGNACGGGTVCAGGVCGLVCTGATTLCGSGANAFCTLTDDDPENCGACGHSCTPVNVDNKACAKGMCGYHQCETDYGDCDDNPANGCETCLSCSTTNCGGCGINCEAVNVVNLGCTGSPGACTWDSCKSGWANCDANAGNGCETPDSDTTCGTACDNCTTTGQHCVAGACS